MKTPGIQRRDGGFTLLEALVYLVFGGMIVGVIHYTVLSNQRSFTEQQAMAGVQGSLRNAMMLLVGELQSVSPEGGDLFRMDPSEIGVRVTRGAGVICGAATGLPDPGYPIAFATGTFEAGAPDSAHVLATHGPGTADDEWRALKLSGVVTANADGSLGTFLGVGFPCGWGPQRRVGLHVSVAGDTSGVALGSPVKPFRHYSFGLFADGGQWWLGRRLRGSGWDMLAGPLLAPADSGLVFRYLDADGVDAASAADVASVEVLMRSLRPGFEVKVDSLRTRVALRG